MAKRITAPSWALRPCSLGADQLLDLFWLPTLWWIHPLPLKLAMPKHQGMASVWMAYRQASWDAQWLYKAHLLWDVTDIARSGSITTHNLSMWPCKKQNELKNWYGWRWNSRILPPSTTLKFVIRANNGVYSAKLFQDSCQKNQQNLTFCAVGAH